MKTRQQIMDSTHKSTPRTIREIMDSHPEVFEVTEQDEVNWCDDAFEEGYAKYEEASSQGFAYDIVNPYQGQITLESCWQNGYNQAAADYVKSVL